MNHYPQDKKFKENNQYIFSFINLFVLYITHVYQFKTEMCFLSANFRHYGPQKHKSIEFSDTCFMGILLLLRLNATYFIIQCIYTCLSTDILK